MVEAMIMEPLLPPGYPRYTADLAPARPFLVPSFDGQPVEVLPSEKQNRKLRFDELVYVQEIKDRFAEHGLQPDQDDDSYEIEIVEDDGDADFYLEIVDGEVYYVFETEDDISVEEEEEEDESESNKSMSDEEGNVQPNNKPVHLPVATLSAPNLDMDSELGESSHFSYDMDDDGNMSDDDDDECDTNVAKAASTVGTAASCESAGPVLIEPDNDDVVVAPVSDAPETSRVDAEPLSSTPQVAVPLSPQKQTVVLDNVPAEISSPAPRSPSGSPKSKLAPPPIPLNITISVESPQATPAQSPVTSKPCVLDSAPCTPKALPSAPALSSDNPRSPPRRQASTASSAAGGYSAPASPSGSTVKSILKACPPSPRKAPRSPRKAKKTAEEKKEKTFTKTYVRAEDFDGEHRAYTWEKPQWAQNKNLKSTGKGDALRTGANLANPITFPKAFSWKHNLTGEEQTDGSEHADAEQMEAVDKEELIRRLMGNNHAHSASSALPRYRKNQKNLKFSILGAKIRDGGDIVKPITKATVIRKPEDVNHIANQGVLKPTQVGRDVRTGASLAAPITKATVIKKYEFSKPEWATKKERLLHATSLGEHVKQGETISAPITHIADTKRYEWEKPEWTTTAGRNNVSNEDHVYQSPTRKKKSFEWTKPSWTKAKLGSTGKGDIVKQGETLSNPITFPKGQGDGINKAVRPENLRHSSKGDDVRSGENLARPITKLPEQAKQQN